LHAFMTSNALTDGTDQSQSFEIYALYGGSLENFCSNVVKVVPSPNPQVTVTLQKLDLTCAEDVQKWVSSNQPDICLHLAALSSPAKCQEDSKRAHDINCPVEFLKALAKSNVDIVALSTDQVYYGTKTSPEEFYVETKDEVGPVNVYATTKVSMEKTLEDLLPSNSVLLRSSIILGPEAPFGGAHQTFLHFCSSREGLSTDYFDDECRSVVAVSDVVAVLQHFVAPGNVAKETAGIYNMGGQDRTSRYDMALAVAERFQFDKQFVVKKQKSSMPPGNVPSPLDISMDSTKLAKILGREAFKGLEDIVNETFPPNTKRP